MAQGSFNNYVDQSLTIFDPLPLEWTEMDLFILSTLCHMIIDPPPPSSRPRSYRMTPQPAWCKTASTCTVSGRFSQELHHHGGGNTICPADFELLSRKLCQNDVACSDVVQLKFLFQTGKKAPSRLLGGIYSFRTSVTFFVTSVPFLWDNFFLPLKSCPVSTAANVCGLLHHADVDAQWGQTRLK